jgi:hypothetical protein
MWNADVNADGGPCLAAGLGMDGTANVLRVYHARNVPFVIFMSTQVKLANISESSLVPVMR